MPAHPDPFRQELEADGGRQRAFIYDVASGRLSPFTALDAAGDRAAAILPR